MRRGRLPAQRVVSRRCALLKMAQQHNQSETAFFVRTDEGLVSCAGLPHSLRSISAVTRPSPQRTLFSNISTILRRRFSLAPVLLVSCGSPGNGDWLTLDFPAWSTSPVQNPPADLLTGLGLKAAVEVREGRDYLVVLADRQQVEAVRPDTARLRTLGKMICVSAPDEEYDFVSRFFCPGEGVPEDPVTGSAHSMLIPWWGEKLGKNHHDGAPGLRSRRRPALPVRRATVC